jgi:hypothetical protein
MVAGPYDEAKHKVGANPAASVSIETIERIFMTDVLLKRC